jgi:hypothetical protein
VNSRSHWAVSPDAANPYTFSAKLGRIAMPFIAAIVGAIFTGLFYWLIWGKGLEYLEHQWRESSNRRRDAKRRSAAIQQQQLAPIRSITDSRDAASVLMVLVAQQRGVLTPEQVGVIEHEMQKVLGLAEDLRPRFAFARFAAEQATTIEDAVDAVAGLLRQTLSPSERSDLLAMMQRVAEVHAGPTAGQEQAITYTERQLIRPS